MNTPLITWICVAALVVLTAIIYIVDSIFKEKHHHIHHYMRHNPHDSHRRRNSGF